MAVFIIILVLLVGFFLRRRFIQGESFSLNRPVSTATETSSPNAPISSKNPFGVMFANVNLVPSAKELGAFYYRPNSIFVENWDGTCDECDKAISSGLKLILTVRNNGGRQVPTTPPTDYNLFKQTLGKIIDKYKPVILVIENEENSKALFYNGTTSDYQQELQAACQVAHQRGIKCTNGGLVSSLVVGLVAQSYKDQGDVNKANDYIQRTLGDKLLSQFGVSDVSQALDNPKVKEQVSRGEELLAIYKKSGADFVNFHWYISDVPALGEAVSYLEKATGLPAITNEVGQQNNEDPNQVTNVMQKISDLKIPIAVWFSVDIQGYGGARSLINPDGSLRPNGEAFKNFIRDNY